MRKTAELQNIKTMSAEFEKTHSGSPQWYQQVDYITGYLLLKEIERQEADLEKER